MRRLTAISDRFSDPREARKKAMDYLARREHSRDELCRKMQKFGFDSEVALDAIEQLQKDGLQSDRLIVDIILKNYYYLVWFDYSHNSVVIFHKSKKIRLNLN